MEHSLYLDTHALVWLYNNELHKFSQSTLELIDNSHLLISPMVILELEYLYEIKRLNKNASVIFETLQQEINLQTCPLNFLEIVYSALKHSWTRDPFDRVIVAQAAINHAMLISKDEMIHANYDNVIWF